MSTVSAPETRARDCSATNPGDGMRITVEGAQDIQTIQFIASRVRGFAYASAAPATCETSVFSLLVPGGFVPLCLVLVVRLR